MILVHAFGFATHLVTSTLVCLVEVWADNDWPRAVINQNIPGYLLFLGAGGSEPATKRRSLNNIACFLWLDMFFRIRAVLTDKIKRI